MTKTEQTREGDTAANAVLLRAVDAIVDNAVEAGRIDGEALYQRIEPMVRASWHEVAFDVNVKKMDAETVYKLLFDRIVHEQTLDHVRRAQRLALEKRISDLEEFISDPARAR